MRKTPKKLATWLRSEEAMAALALFTAGQIQAQAVDKPGPLSLGRIARRRPSNPTDRHRPKTASKEKDVGKQK